MPVLQPRGALAARPAAGSVYGRELLRVRDRHDREFCLGPTARGGHHRPGRAATCSSYRQLPLNLYQIQTKFRDEIRPRFGLMRAREFIMKDAYSFDTRRGGARARATTRCTRPTRASSSAAACRFRPSRPTPAPSAATPRHEFMVLAETGEDAVVILHGLRLRGQRREGRGSDSARRRATAAAAPGRGRDTRRDAPSRRSRLPRIVAAGPPVKAVLLRAPTASPSSCSSAATTR